MDKKNSLNNSCNSLPPIAVFLKSGANKNLAINIVLFLFIYIPVIVQAL